MWCACPLSMSKREETMLMKDFVNTVPGSNQLKEKDYLNFMFHVKASKKVLIVGNSITRHASKADIGWHGDWGMAASCADNDYVHILHRKLTEHFGAVSICVAQAGAWEMSEHAKKEEKLIECYKPAAQFEADILIIRIGENVDMSKTSISELAEDFGQMIRFFGGARECSKVIVTGQFWESPEREEAVMLAARRHGYYFVPLSDLGMNEKMTAMGLFEHAGVAGHPGDLGMHCIAQRIMNKIKEIYTESESSLSE